MARTLRDTGPRRRIPTAPILERDTERASPTMPDEISPATPMPLNSANGTPGIADVTHVPRSSNDANTSVSNDSDLAEGTSSLLVVEAPPPDPAGLQQPRDDPSAIEIKQGQPAVTRRLQGRIEGINKKEIKGWVWDPQAPSERICLELVENDTQLLVTVAGLNRPDLVQLGCGDGRHGFSIELDNALLADGQHVVTIRCVKTGAEMPGSPVSFEYRRAAATSASADLSGTASRSQSGFRGYIDKVTESGIQGWIMMPGEPSRRSTVVLKEQDRILARAIASQFRADLLSAGVGDGCYSFEFEPPRSVLDGQEHMLDVMEEETGTHITKELILWCSRSDMDQRVARPPYAKEGDRQATRADGLYQAHRSAAHLTSPDVSRSTAYGSAGHVGTRMLFDISDLIYYLGHHANLTGIQRVQSSIVLAMIDQQILAPSAVIFLSFNATTRTWVAIPTGFLISLLRDLFLPEQQRLIRFSMEAASCGVLPGAQQFDGTGALDDGNPSVLCLLGAAWVQQDYLHRVLTFKRNFGTRFVMMVHDLIPIYARETCDQDTVRVFEHFMLRVLPHVDHLLAVSEYTAKDIRRYLATLRVPEPPITVTKNGSSFAEFLPKNVPAGQITLRDLPKRFVLFVATIEGRKNHRFMLDVWRRMADGGADLPHLICVGRLGWKAGAFINPLVETNYLNGRIHLLREISDFELRTLYDRCLFTVCPTLYEGWGLPVGEALAMGKICVSSTRTSIPEVAGDCGVYIDIDDIDRSLKIIRDLIHDDKARAELEAKIRRDYRPVTWSSVAERVVGACEASVAVEWPEPYPHSALPYSTEISFGQLDRDIDGSGEPLLTRIVEARTGHFTYDLLNEQSFLTGELIRSTGNWALPERWGTWLCKSGGDIVFALAPEVSEFYYFYLRLRVSKWLFEHTVRLLANGEILWEGSIGANSKDIILRVRKRTGIVGTWLLRIEAQVDLTSEVRNEIAAFDGRVPTIGFERLVVVPENDVKARLDVLSKFLR